MTDFVNRLLGGTSSGAPPIRPLTGSLFEPRTARDVDRDPPMPGGVEESPPRTPQEPPAPWIAYVEREPPSGPPESTPRRDPGGEPQPPPSRPADVGVEAAEQTASRHGRPPAPQAAAPTRAAVRPAVPPPDRPSPGRAPRGEEIATPDAANVGCAGTDRGHADGAGARSPGPAAACGGSAIGRRATGFVALAPVTRPC